MQVLGQEVLIYDPVSSQTHLLQEVSARIFLACDGATLAEIYAQVEAEASEEAVRRQLAELVQLGVVRMGPESSGEKAWGRREFLASSARTAASLAIVTAAMPEPAGAISSCSATTFPLTTLSTGSGNLDVVQSASICIARGATSVVLESTGGGNLVDEFLMLSATGSGATVSVRTVSSYTPNSPCPSPTVNSTQLPLTITALFNLPSSGVIIPMVSARFCNGAAGPFTRPATWIRVNY